MPSKTQQFPYTLIMWIGHKLSTHSLAIFFFLYFFLLDSLLCTTIHRVYGIHNGFDWTTFFQCDSLARVCVYVDSQPNDRRKKKQKIARRKIQEKWFRYEILFQSRFMTMKCSLQPPYHRHSVTDHQINCENLMRWSVQQQ